MQHKYNLLGGEGQAVSTAKERWVEGVVERLRESLESLYDELEGEEVEFERIEESFRDVFMEAGRVSMEEFLARRDGYIGRVKRCRCGGELEFHSYRDRGIVSLLGVVRVRRAYYYCRSCGRSFIPFDERNGFKGSSFSLRVREIATKLGSSLTFRESSEILRDLGIEISSSQLRRFTEGFGGYIFGEVSSGGILFGGGEIEGEMYVEADGTEVRTLSGFKEAKLGVIFDGDKSRVRYLGSFLGSERFGDILWRGSEVLGVGRSDRVIVIGDGARWIWNISLTNYPGSIEVVDFYHACEHLWEVGRVFYGEGSKGCKEWAEREVENLRDGKVEVVLEDMRSLMGVKKDLDELLEREIGYFSGNRDRMRYDDFLKMGLSIGSGVVESGCKHVIGIRLKRPGMRWKLENAESILQVRIANLNGSFDEYWEGYRKAA